MKTTVRPAPVVLALALAATSLPATETWRPFSPDSPWNTPIAANAPTDRDSATLIADLASRGPWYVNVRNWSIPVYFVDADHTPRHDVGDSRPGVYGRGFEFPRAIPIPDDAVASPPVGEHSDNHLAIIDRARGLEWGMWAARRDATGRWFTGLGAVTDLNGTGVAPPWYENPRELDSHRARAGGFPLIAGLIRVEEIKAGRIPHALCFAYDHCRSGLFVPPASTAQVRQLDAVDSRGIPMGGRIQLDPTWDVAGSSLTPAGKIIARALQEYGAYCGDYAGANVLYAENSPAAVAAWAGLLDPKDLAQLFNPDFIRRYFRVIDLGTLLPGQNLGTPPPYLVNLTIGGQASRIDPYYRTVALPAGDRAGPVTWQTHPRGTSVRFNAPDLAAANTITLTAPDGSVSEWRIQR